jgi:hypothetical protein
MLSCLPNAEEVIAVAKANGWSHSRMTLGGQTRDVLSKPNKSSIILQIIPEQSWYSHPVARSYARLLGVLIESVPTLKEASS